MLFARSGIRREEMSFLYLTTRGWKTGKPHKIEIWYVGREGHYYIVAEMRERTHWVQNIKRNPRVEMTIGKKESSGKGRILDPEKDKETIKEVAKLMNEKYGWSEGTIVELAPD